MGASSSSRSLGQEKWNSNSVWMSELPDHVQKIDLTEIAIPGSHDSFTYDIKKSGDICKVNLPKFLKKFINFRFVRYFVYNWSITQNLSVLDQLENGIRYFDIRIASKIEKEGCQVYYVHGMYSRKVLLYLEEMKQFLVSHKNEVVILDFNHFYSMCSDDHCELIESMLELFGPMVCPVRQQENLSLQWMWDNGYQIIIIYHCQCDPPQKFLWPKTCIRSRWPNKTSCEDVLKILEEEWQSEHDIPHKFKVYQGVVTPDTNFILKWFRYTLKESLTAMRAFEKFVHWVQARKPHQSDPAKKILEAKHQTNIIIADFVDFCGFSDAVIRLNFAD